jgi:glycerol-3-phosphate O-acyltransferase
VTSPVSLPLWLFLLLVAFAAWAVLERVLVPGVRWWLRRRINTVIDEVNTHLNISIRAFQLTKRQVLIDRLAFDPKVIEAMQAFAAENKMPRAVAQAKVLRYAREIVPAFNAYAYFRVGYWLAEGLARLLYRVRVGFADNERLAQIDPEATVVFVMNHRSNMDYVLAAFLAAEQTALSYAVGEWARIWPLQQLVRAMGAYFVRRNSKNPLYRRVLERYVNMATWEGVCQAVFPEGGLSRDGKLQKPKLGILDYMLRGFDPGRGRDIVFVPVGLNYDRTLEDRSLVRRLDPNAARRSRLFVLRTTFGFIGHNLWLMLRNRWLRFGYASVNFGTPVSARAWCREHRINPSELATEQRGPLVEKLATELMQHVGRLVPVLPVPLVADALLAAPGGISDFDLKAAVYAHIEALKQQGAVVIVPSRTRAFTIDTAFNTLKLRHLVIEDNGLFRPDPDAHNVLAYYANSLEAWPRDLSTDRSRHEENKT